VVFLIVLIFIFIVLIVLSVLSGKNVALNDMDDKPESMM